MFYLNKLYNQAETDLAYANRNKIYNSSAGNTK